MKDLISLLKANRGFIEAVASAQYKPQHDNTTLVTVIKAYQDIDPTIEVLYGCATCSTPYKTTFQTILAYLNDNDNRTTGLPDRKKNRAN